jgi:hypothetical protein
MTHFLSPDALKCFAKQIVSHMYDNQTSSTDGSEYLLYHQTIHNGLEIGRDMDILLGFTTESSTPVTFTIRISNVDVATKTVVKTEFQSVLDMGQCIPLTSLENYRISFHVYPEDATLTCFIGRLRNIRKRVQVKEAPWKYISFARKFFLVKCTELHIQHITHIRDFEWIPYLPNIEYYVDECIEEWKKQRCQAMVDTILQDLMEKTWHPSRHMDWCLDHEEREGLGLTP